jgi:hypothetical protein
VPGVSPEKAPRRTEGEKEEGGWKKKEREREVMLMRVSNQCQIR